MPICRCRVEPGAQFIPESAGSHGQSAYNAERYTPYAKVDSGVACVIARLYTSEISLTAP